MPMWVKDRGESECSLVIGEIGDETIAPTRKGADFRVVAYREIGLLYLTPEGMETSPPGGKMCPSPKDSAGVVQW